MSDDTAATANVLEAPVATEAPATQQQQAAPAKDGAVAEPWYRGWVNEDGSLNKTRYDLLPDELKDIKPSLSQLNTLNDALKTWKHDRSLVGKKGLTPLRPDASETERAEWLSRMREVNGVPEKPEGYAIAKPETIPDEFWNQDYVNDMAKLMHEHAISPKTVEALVAANNQWTQKELQRYEETQAQAREAKIKEINRFVTEKWGKDLPKNLDIAKSAAKRFGVNVDSPAFTENPEVAMAFYEVGKLFKESKFVDGDGNTNVGPSAQEQLDAISRDPSNKYYQAMVAGDRHPLFAEAVRVQSELSKKIAEERFKKR